MNLSRCASVVVPLLVISVSPAFAADALKLSRKADSYRAHGDWPHEIEVLGKLVELWSGTTGPNSPTVAHYLLAQAEAYEMNGDIASAFAAETHALTALEGIFGSDSEAAKSARKTSDRLQGKSDQPDRGQADLNLPATEPTPQALRSAAGVTAPRLVSKVEPVYSEQARQAKLEGTIKLRMIVGADGRVRIISIVDPLGLGLDEQAVEAVKQWKFEPGLKDGKPVAVVCNAEVNFHLLV